MSGHRFVRNLDGIGLLSLKNSKVFVGRLTRDWEGDELETAKSASAMAKLVPAILILFAVLYTLLGFDLLMSLAPQWYSTLYGWLFFLHGFYGALVVITILAIAARKAFRLETGFRTSQFHDLGRLVMGFCMLSGGFYWSQYLVIWYGNLTEEIPYLLVRFHNPLWVPLTWYYIVFAFFFPLAIFLSKRAKEKPAILVVVASIILSSLFVERFLAVAPFLWHESTFPFGIMELLVSLAFAVRFRACMVQIYLHGSPHFKESLNRVGTESTKKRLMCLSPLVAYFSYLTIHAPEKCL